MPKQTIKITVLQEDTELANPAIQTEHGLSFFIEADGQCGLFDTGQSDAFVGNASALGCDLGALDWIGLSHGHYDHSGGLKAVLALPRRQPRLVAHPAAFVPKYIRDGDGSLRRGGQELTVDQVEGHCQMALQAEPSQISDHIGTTGEVPRLTSFEQIPDRFLIEGQGALVPDSFPDDLSLLLRTAQGTVVLAGCAHSGIVNILHQAQKLTDGAPIYGIVGGIHLCSASAERQAETIKACRELEVQNFWLCHCTGQQAKEAFRQEFGERCHECHAGTVLSFLV
jgi:7,8-dihydropterin-6-yl-methyl-4-(beta-D-ribofuranosyl)aminobenzene 5'-phosphate synthase